MARLDQVQFVEPNNAEASAADWDQIEAATRRPDATICLTSALAHHDLTDTIPAALDVAIPRGSRTPASTGAIAWHQFDRATFEIGREQITIPGSTQTIGIYSPERSITDAFRGWSGQVGSVSPMWPSGQVPDQSEFAGAGDQHNSLVLREPGPLRQHRKPFVAVVQESATIRD